jgi:hypothetical protein
MGLDTKTYCLTDRQSQCDFDFGLTAESSWQEPDGESSREETDTGGSHVKKSCRLFKSGVY